MLLGTKHAKYCNVSMCSWTEFLPRYSVYGVKLSESKKHWYCWWWWW